MPQPLTTTETTHFDTVIVGFGKASKTLAGMLARAGRSVALVERSPAMFGGTCINIGCVPTKTLLHDADLHHQRGSDDTAAAVEQVLADAGIAFAHATELASVDAPADGPLTLHLTSGATTRELEVDALLLSTGRVSATDGLGLEAAGVEVDERGAIVVDDFLRTSADKVWAVGDVNGGPQHTCVSLDDHRIVADQLLRDRGEGGRSLANRGPVPSTTFLTPPLSRVGLSAEEPQAQAAANGWDVVVARKNVADIAAMPRPKAVANPRGFLQVVVDRATERILGATLFCVESQEVINLVTMAMRHDLPYPALRDAIYTHPSSTEGLNEVLGAI